MAPVSYTHLYFANISVTEAVNPGRSSPVIRMRMSSVFESCIKKSFNPAKIEKKVGTYAKEHKKLWSKSKKFACLFGSYFNKYLPLRPVSELKALTINGFLSV